MAAPLRRTTFTTNRVLEFFSEKELTMQLGHSRAMWPVALLKELLDNALDGCEQAGVSCFYKWTTWTSRYLAVRTRRDRPSFYKWSIL